MKDLDSCFRCGSSISLERSEFENSEPVSLSGEKFICATCYKNLSKSEYDSFFK